MNLTGWHRLWLIWFLISVGSFLVFEIYGLCTDWRRTLSAAVWNLEKFKPGQSVSQWSALHLWFVGILGLLFLWLIMHFGDGWWRS